MSRLSKDATGAEVDVLLGYQYPTYTLGSLSPNVPADSPDRFEPPPPGAPPASPSAALLAQIAQNGDAVEGLTTHKDGYVWEWRGGRWWPKFYVGDF